MAPVRVSVLVIACLLLVVTTPAGAGDLHDDMIEVRSVEHDEAAGVVRGEVANVSGSSLHDVRLRVLVSWLWKDERNPGEDDQSWGTIVSLPGPLAPGEVASFEARRPFPAPARDDGSFHVKVSVAGLSRRTESFGPP